MSSWLAGPQLAEHQREAVAKARHALREYGAVLLADEVGLGKSYVAAELIRCAAGRVELVVPASLVSQWRETLDAFGCEATIATHDSLHNLDGSPPALIVVDEAHGFRNPHTRRYDALARRAAGSRLLLVTATPICNGTADLRALLHLMARDDLLAGNGVPSIDAAFETRDRPSIDAILAALVIRRPRDVLPPELAFGELQRRIVRHRLFTAGGEIDALIDALEFPLIGESALLRRFLWRRLESSEAALLESIRRQLRFYERALSCLASGRVLPKREYAAMFGRDEDREVFQQVLFWEVFAPPGTISAASIEGEMDRLRRLAAAVDRSPREKLAQLLAILRDDPEPVIVFTGAAATAHELHAAIRSMRRCGLVTSRLPTAAAALRDFCAGRVDVLVSTDMSAEGLNLQRAATIVHYDIPWNPVRLDQRNGRAHRIGQSRAAVRAIYFLCEEDPTRVVSVMASKNRARRSLLGHPPAVQVISSGTVRPRVTTDAAVARFAAAAVSETFARRHREGLERMIRDRARQGALASLADLESLAAFPGRAGEAPI